MIAVNSLRPSGDEQSNRLFLAALVNRDNEGRLCQLDQLYHLIEIANASTSLFACREHQALDPLSGSSGCELNQFA